MTRLVIPEKLDSLPFDDPGAESSRRDLRFFNTLFATTSWFRRRLLAQLQESDRILELGAGDGWLTSRLIETPGGRIELPRERWHTLDRHYPPANGKEAHRRIVADILEFEGYRDFSVVFGNLILHHFNARDLGVIGRRLQQAARCLVFQETRRSWRHYACSRAISAFMHPVTRHDAPASVRAGFRNRELPELLGLGPPDWAVTIETSLVGAYRMLAVRS